MMHWQFPPMSRPRSPLLQALLGIVGMALVIGIGLFALGALAVIVVTLAIAFAIRRAFSPLAASAPASVHHPDQVGKPVSGNVIDGQFEVVRRDRQG